MKVIKALYRFIRATLNLHKNSIKLSDTNTTKKELIKLAHNATGESIDIYIDFVVSFPSLDFGYQLTKTIEEVVTEVKTNTGQRELGVNIVTSPFIYIALINTVTYRIQPLANIIATTNSENIKDKIYIYIGSNNEVLVVVNVIYPYDTIPFNN